MYDSSSVPFPLSSFLFPLSPFPHVPPLFPRPPLKTALRCEPDPRVYRVTGAHEHRVNGLYRKKGNHSKCGMWVKVDPLTVAKAKERAKARRALKKAKKKKKKKRKKKRRREEDEPVEAVEGGASNMEVGGEEGEGGGGGAGGGEGGSAEEGDVEDGSAAEEKESDELAELAAHTMMALVRCQMNRGSHQWFLSLSDTRSPGTDKVRGGGKRGDVRWCAVI